MAAQPKKPYYALILDTGPLIKNEVTISTLIASAEELYTTPAIISEIRDPATRSRVETTLLPFLKIRTPSPASYEVVANFSKKTGDFAVLSQPDLQILALAYEVECERLGGNWRLRSTPGQKGLNGSPPKKENGKEDTAMTATGKQQTAELATRTEPEPLPKTDQSNSDLAVKEVETHISYLHVSSDTPAKSNEQEPSADSEGEWITPSNIKKHREKDSGNSSTKDTKPPTQIAAATMTTDFAMQNILLQMNLNLLSTNLSRIKNLRTYILRCHACFFTTKQMEKQFCPRCGQPTLNRVACSTNANGEFKLYLAKNFQWNTRGDRFSIPKPVAGAANQKKIQGGGKGGWGNDLILAEDQKEYVRAVGEEKRAKTRDLMDQDYLPGILTGDRGRSGGRPKVGAGRNVNSKKRFK